MVTACQGGDWDAARRLLNVLLPSDRSHVLGMYDVLLILLSQVAVDHGFVSFLVAKFDLAGCFIGPNAKDVLLSTARKGEWSLLQGLISAQSALNISDEVLIIALETRKCDIVASWSGEVRKKHVLCVIRMVQREWHDGGHPSGGTIDSLPDDVLDMFKHVVRGICAHKDHECLKVCFMFALERETTGFLEIVREHLAKAAYWGMCEELVVEVKEPCLDYVLGHEECRIELSDALFFRACMKENEILALYMLDKGKYDGTSVFQQPFPLPKNPHVTCSSGLEAAAAGGLYDVVRRILEGVRDERKQESSFKDLVGSAIKRAIECDILETLHMLLKVDNDMSPIAGDRDRTSPRHGDIVGADDDVSDHEQYDEQHHKARNEQAHLKHAIRNRSPKAIQYFVQERKVDVDEGSLVWMAADMPCHRDPKHSWAGIVSLLPESSQDLLASEAMVALNVKLLRHILTIRKVILSEDTIIRFCKDMANSSDRNTLKRHCANEIFIMMSGCHEEIVHMGISEAGIDKERCPLWIMGAEYVKPCSHMPYGVWDAPRSAAIVFYMAMKYNRRLCFPRGVNIDFAYIARFSDMKHLYPVTHLWENMGHVMGLDKYGEHIDTEDVRVSALHELLVAGFRVTLECMRGEYGHDVNLALFMISSGAMVSSTSDSKRLCDGCNGQDGCEQVILRGNPAEDGACDHRCCFQCFRRVSLADFQCCRCKSSVAWFEVLQDAPQDAQLHGDQEVCKAVIPKGDDAKLVRL